MLHNKPKQSKKQYMEIKIEKKKISLKEGYVITIDGKQAYAASRGVWKAGVQLFKDGSATPVLTIKPKFTWSRPKYNLVAPDGTIHLFETKKMYTKFDAICINGDDTYEVCGHRGRKYSIFKNNVQVAWWSKKAISFFAGDSLKLITDDKIDLDFILALCITVEHLKTRRRKNRYINMDFGKIFQSRKFDKNWQPKLDSSKPAYNPVI
jgi:uncharacterized protein YxjI